MDKKHNVCLGLVTIIVLVIFYSLFCMKMNEISETEKEQKETEINSLYEKITELENKIEMLETENSELIEQINTFNVKNAEAKIMDENEFSDEEVELFAKFIAYYCKNEPDSTKTYVGYVLMNRMYEQKISLSDVIDGFGVARNNLEAVETTNEGSIVKKILHMSYEEVQTRSSGTTYFFEKDKMQENDIETLLTLFRSGKYVFFTDLANG